MKINPAELQIAIAVLKAKPKPSKARAKPAKAQPVKALPPLVNGRCNTHGCGPVRGTHRPECKRSSDAKEVWTCGTNGCGKIPGCHRLGCNLLK